MMGDAPKEVRTLADMAQETMRLEAAARRGIACPACGCRDWRVASTRRDEGIIRRYRVCRNCGHHKTTTEY